MKTRELFVANSSGTSFIVVLPDNIKTLSLEHLPKKERKEVISLLAILYKDRVFISEGEDDESYQLLADFLEKEGLVLLQNPVSSDYSDITALRVADLQKIESVVQLMEMAAAEKAKEDTCPHY